MRHQTAIFISVFNLISILIFIAPTGFAQTTINGTVTSKKGEALAGANVFLKGSYDGTSTDSTGAFQFITRKTDSVVLIARYLGYAEFQTTLVPDGTAITLYPKLKETITSIGEIVITAGAFEASDEKKGVVLSPLDIVTTAGATGDIAGALNTLPGTQTVGEEGQLFVRGGSASETRTFIDGLRVQNPYSSRVPNIPGRGRFSPFQFKGTLFTTGGYSAEYGQALSSALILNTQDMPDKTLTGISLMTVGGELSHTHRWEKTSLAATVGYTNLAPYFALVNQEVDWDPTPNSIGGGISFRHTPNQTGMVKGFATYSKSNTGIIFPDINNPATNSFFSNKNDNFFFNGTYKELLKDKWVLRTGGTFSFNKEDIAFNEGSLTTREQSGQVRAVISRPFSERFKLMVGATAVYNDYQVGTVRQAVPTAGLGQPAGLSLREIQGATFVETDIRISRHLAARVGVRAEYSQLLKKANLAPRLSMAYKTGDHGQFSFAFGQFYQNPENDMMRFTTDLNFEKADHYILNYQYMKDKRIFRVEGYYKTYSNLVKVSPEEPTTAASFLNSGDGYARGFDIFLRDRKTFKNTDYWVSYSFLDTERNFRDFPESAVPIFASKHNLSVVGKRYFSDIRSQVGMTYTFGSGRSFHNPNENGFLTSRTPNYHDLSFNWSYLTDLWDNFTILYISVTNVVGSNQVFGYRYATEPDPSGQFNRVAIRPPAKRFIFVGLFISLE